MTYKAAIFDLDGTLADTLASIAHSANMALEQLGFPALPLDNYRYYAGDGAQELMKQALAACGDTACSRLEEIMPVYAAIFEKECMYQVHPYDGIPEVLEALKQQGLKIAVLSNKPDARTHDVIRDLFGTELFDYVQGQTEKIRRKPCPDGALEIARRSRGTPRLANRLLKRVRDWAQVRGDGIIDEDVAAQALSFFEVDALGLDMMDNRILELLAVQFGGRPVGLTTLASALSEDTDTLEDVYEPYLMQQGLLVRTPKGRICTERAYDHLGIPVPPFS